MRIGSPLSIVICVVVLLLLIALIVDSRKAFLKYRREAKLDKLENQRLAKEAKDLEKT